MRKVSFLLITLVVLCASPAIYGEGRREREGRGVIDRAVRIVRSIFGVRATGDVLSPPLPAPRRNG